jgi:hypothetical protein
MSDAGNRKWAVVVQVEFTEDVAEAEEIEAELEDWLRANASGGWDYSGNSTDAVDGTAAEFFYFERERDARSFAEAFGGVVTDTEDLPPLSEG